MRPIALLFVSTCRGQCGSQQVVNFIKLFAFASESEILLAIQGEGIYKRRVVGALGAFRGGARHDPAHRVDRGLAGDTVGYVRKLDHCETAGAERIGNKGNVSARNDTR